MAEGICKVEYYSIDLANKCGTGAHILAALKEAGINFAGMWGYPLNKTKARLDVIADDGAALKKAAKQLKIALGPKQLAFLVTGEDRPGAVADVLAKLAAAGVNVRATAAVCAGEGRFGALVQVEPADVRKAAKALGA